MINYKPTSLNYMLPWINDQLNHDLNPWEFTGWTHYDPRNKREEFFLIHAKMNVGLWTWTWSWTAR